MRLKQSSRKNYFTSMIGLFVASLLTGCRLAGTPEATVTLPPDSGPDVVEPSPTTLVETPAAPGMVVILSTGFDDLAGAESAVANAASQHGLLSEVRQEFTPADAPMGLTMVVLTPSYPSVAELAAGLPDVDFLVWGAGGPYQSPNVQVVGARGDANDQAFIAGYIAAVESQEYRVGIIGLNTSEGQNYRQAFLNGAIYFCGTCSPLFPPFEVYPVYAEVPPGSGQAEVDAAAAQLLARGVRIVHLAPEVSTQANYPSLAAQGFRIIGAIAPPAGLEGSWIASVMLGAGISLEQAVTTVLSGGEVEASTGGVTISHSSFSDARLDHFRAILNMVETGEIDAVGAVQ